VRDTDAQACPRRWRVAEDRAVARGSDDRIAALERGVRAEDRERRRGRIERAARAGDPPRRERGQGVGEALLARPPLPDPETDGTRGAVEQVAGALTGRGEPDLRLQPIEGPPLHLDLALGAPEDARSGGVHPIRAPTEARRELGAIRDNQLCRRDGVGARTSAAKSARVTSTSWPTPLTTGSRWATIARTTPSSLNDQRSSREPPPRARIVTAGASEARFAAPSRSTWRSIRRSARTMDSAEPSPCTAAATSTTRTSGHRRASTVQTSFQTAPVGDVTTATTAGRDGSGRLRAASNRPSEASFAFSCSKRSARLPTPDGWIDST